MNDLQRDVRFAVYTSFRERSEAPSVDVLAAGLWTTRDEVIAALRALADEHCLVLQPGSESQSPLMSLKEA